MFLRYVRVIVKVIEAQKIKRKIKKYGEMAAYMTNIAEIPKLTRVGKERAFACMCNAN